MGDYLHGFFKRVQCKEKDTSVLVKMKQVDQTKYDLGLQRLLKQLQGEYTVQLMSRRLALELFTCVAQKEFCAKETTSQ